MAHDAHRERRRARCRAPAVVGLLQIARVARSSPPTTPESSNRQTPFTPTFDLVRRQTCGEADVPLFLLDVLAGAERLSDELRAAALQLLLSAPAGLLSARELAPALRDALAVGAHHPPHRTHARWTSWTDLPESVSRVLPGHTTHKMAATVANRRVIARPTARKLGLCFRRWRVMLRAYVPAGLREKTESGDDLPRRRERGGIVAREFFMSISTCSAPPNLRAPPTGRRSPSTTSTRASRACSARWAARRTPSSTTTIGARVPSCVPSGVVDALGLRAARPSFEVGLLHARHHLAGPQIVSRPARRALRSVLHGPSREGRGGCRVPSRRDAVLMVGRNARLYQLRAGTMRGKPRRSTRSTGGCSRRCWSWRTHNPSGYRQLFSALATQLVRWFTSQAREAAENRGAA